MIMIELNNREVFNKVMKEKGKKEALKSRAIVHLKNKFLRNEIDFQDSYYVGVGFKNNGKFKLEKMFRVSYNELLESMKNDTCKVKLDKFNPKCKKH